MFLFVVSHTFLSNNQREQVLVSSIFVPQTMLLLTMIWANIIDPLDRSAVADSSDNFFHT